jgi:hypothetical protein
MIIQKIYVLVKGQGMGAKSDSQDATRNVQPSLSPAQGKAIEALASGANLTEAAEKAGVDRTTLYRWRRDDPGFIAAYNSIAGEALERIRSGIRGLAEPAMCALKELLLSPTPASVRLGAIKIVLACVDQADSGELIDSQLPEDVHTEIRTRKVERLDRESALDRHETILRKGLPPN